MTVGVRTRATLSFRTHAWAAAALLAAAHPARADIVEIGWQPNGRMERAVAVAPGKFVELCGRLDNGQAVDWSFESDAPMDFNIHYHEGKQVIFPAKQDQVAHARGQLAVAVDQHYCWMWRNKSTTTAQLRVLLQR
jgi:hypothetical protein